MPTAYGPPPEHVLPPPVPWLQAPGAFRCGSYANKGEAALISIHVPGDSKVLPGVAAAVDGLRLAIILIRSLCGAVSCHFTQSPHNTKHLPYNATPILGDSNVYKMNGPVIAIYRRTGNEWVTGREITGSDKGSASDRHQSCF